MQKTEFACNGNFVIHALIILKYKTFLKLDFSAQVKTGDMT